MLDAGQEHNFSYKNGQMADIMKDKAQAAKDKASEMVGSGKDRTVESKDQTSSYVSHKAGAVKDMTCETVQAAKEFRLREPFIPRGIG
nr:PREDICTED: late embryogenesis abundant protein Dc3-like [Daucus carota subsp. sativus]